MLRRYASHAAAQLRMTILGAPGSGKGTLSSRLLARNELASVVVGDLLRKEVSLGTELGLKAEAVMRSGGLLPDEVIARLMQPHLQALSAKDWLIDGYPRTARQAQLLDDALESFGDRLTLIVNLDVPDRVILQRIEERWIHAPSGRTYNLSFNPPKVAGKDDVTGEALSKRPDDDVATFAKRLERYHKENKPLLDYYAKAGDRLVTVQGETSDITWPKLEAIISSRFKLTPKSAQ
ncbi:uncharacterized protein L969DRAFT_26732 [Mixia osmundae IAM 14324]|uniref:GTP:AMP phosphotransferase, mitochondrial n=1 Tax=Mixia osmundae (strain CBS 9802 / IAM 14324 / JCM 22182 / KY 12970) TaxID=764103 RepID=G7DUL5_MIXOS|nr:uncharacterized protein L969DRAFT_26732 [Mixia osmundae IAM 14324]KEI36391.1 hypothetical protein L969DRAFT_26732 [Mixia osmundae IAM 14324]GAA94275.1 hypothetical protein E5Q_00924 [Mixia osmundae IAM 14324]